MATISHIFLLVFFLSTMYVSYSSWLIPNVFCKYPLPDFKCKTKVEVYANRLDSVQSVLVYEYDSFDFCSVSDEPSPAQNLGQILLGDRIRPSPYKFNFLENQNCVKICTKKYNFDDIQQQDLLKRLMKGIAQNYQQNWIIDNVPVMFCYAYPGQKEGCSRGTPIGFYFRKSDSWNGTFNIYDAKNDTFYVFNHLDFVIGYHSSQDEIWGNSSVDNTGQITFAIVRISSLNSTSCKRNIGPLMFQSISKEIKIHYTYSIRFIKDNVTRWATRWDYILQESSLTRVHWYSALTSLFLVVFVASGLAIYLFRGLRKDINRYKEMFHGDDVQKKFGWKLIHGDVFRPPQKGMLLAILVANGVQIAIMFLIILTFAGFDLFSPENPGSLLTNAVWCYVLLGMSAGYTSARLYKMFGGENWKKNGFITAVSCSGTTFIVFSILTFFHWTNGSSAAIPLTTYLTLFILWFCVSVPLTLVGAYLGSKRPAIQNPGRINPIPRQIPKQKWYDNPHLLNLVGGSCLFHCITTPVDLIWTSIFFHQYYYYPKFLLVTYVIFILMCSVTAMVICYHQLSIEDYNWWWYPLLTAGSCALNFLLYSIYCFARKSAIVGGTSTFLHFGYTLILAFILFLLTGAIGFLVCFWFVRTLYSVTTEKHSTNDDSIATS